jgi:hypothetical protein
VSIEDGFECAGRHQIELFFHLHEEAHVVSIQDGEAQIDWRGRRIIFLSPDGQAHWEIIRGSENPRLGWRSRHFNQKLPIPTLRIRREIDGSITLRTHLRMN